VFLALSVLFFFPLASFAQEQSEATQEIGEIILDDDQMINIGIGVIILIIIIGEIILDDDQMINIGIGVIILIIIIAGIVVATRKKSEPHSYKDV
jgi:hypothetical protein